MKNTIGQKMFDTGLVLCLVILSVSLFDTFVGTTPPSHVLFQLRLLEGAIVSTGTGWVLLYL